jgi:hypothetical protein
MPSRELRTATQNPKVEERLYDGTWELLDMWSFCAQGKLLQLTWFTNAQPSPLFVSPTFCRLTVLSAVHSGWDHSSGIRSSVSQQLNLEMSGDVLALYALCYPSTLTSFVRQRYHQYRELRNNKGRHPCTLISWVKGHLVRDCDGTGPIFQFTQGVRTLTLVQSCLSLGAMKYQVILLRLAPALPNSKLAKMLSLTHCSMKDIMARSLAVSEKR